MDIKKFKGLKVTEREDSLLLKVLVRPSSAKRSFSLTDEGELRAKLISPAVDDKANQELIATLSKMLKIPKSSVLIESGCSSKSKKVALFGLSLAELKELFLARVGEDGILS
ncbi:MAG: DUF167 family protein [Actinomycetota bacterium]|nr:DUF167 family protein [Actinomycetota bacterium]